MEAKCPNCDYQPIKTANEGHSCVGRLVRQKEELQKLLDAYRLKRQYDGGEGRAWNASKHYDAEQEVARLEILAQRGV